MPDRDKYGFYAAIFAAIGLLSACGETPQLETPPVEIPPQPIEIFTLANDKLSYSYTPQVGGRGVAFAARGKRNLLKVDDEALAQPAAAIDINAEHTGYNGHIVWLGPQTEWWRKQALNPERYEAAAVWPPDPYTVLATNSRSELSDNAVMLEAPASPVSGVQLSKIMTLEPDALVHKVVATNSRDDVVGWDIWFNTRMSVTTQVYVPVADFDNDLRIEQYGPEAMQQNEELRERGFFDFERGLPMTGKAFIQPSAGWIAAFTADQLFVIEFKRQPRERIHPQQGQVEIYLDYQPGNLDASLLELEVHAPYVELQSGESMQASERWRAWPYSGPNHVDAHLRELRERGYVAYAQRPEGQQ